MVNHRPTCDASAFRYMGGQEPISPRKIDHPISPDSQQHRQNSPQFREQPAQPRRTGNATRKACGNCESERKSRGQGMRELPRPPAPSRVRAHNGDETRSWGMGGRRVGAHPPEGIPRCATAGTFVPPLAGTSSWYFCTFWPVLPSSADRYFCQYVWVSVNARPMPHNGHMRRMSPRVVCRPQ